MSTQIGDKKVFSLEEVAKSIQKTLGDRYGNQYWIQAEINKLNFYPHSGHCFPELVEKRDGKVVAEMRSILWKTDYERIQSKFLSVLHEPLKDGILVLMLASIQFDPVYGLSLKIHEIDPAFSLGQLELEKQASIARLKKEGAFFQNKQQEFPLLPKRLAIISVETSKGFSDFMKIIKENPWRYHFEHELFPAVLQGEKAVTSIQQQLSKIEKIKHQFDVVLIIRGGGGEVGLSCYNHYELAARIARFPLPVMTGIGHSTNETVSEMVAFESAITPSELADFLIQRFHKFAEQIRFATQIITQQVPALLQQQQQVFQKMAEKIRFNVFQNIATHKNRLLQMEWSLKTHASQKIQTERHQISKSSDFIKQGVQSTLQSHVERIKHLAQKVELLDPIFVLRRGYSITLDEAGKAILHPKQLKIGTKVHTILAEGSIESEVLKTTIEEK